MNTAFLAGDVGGTKTTLALFEPDGDPNQPLEKATYSSRGYKALEDILFDAPDMKEPRMVIDSKYVEDKLKDIKDDEDLSRYIL